MTPTARFACLALSAVLLAACQQTDPAEGADAQSAADAAPADATVDEGTTQVVTDNAALDAGELDVRAFAGTFNGTLPCAGCPGIQTELILSADGTFAMTETSIGETDGTRQVQGTWAPEEDGARLRLDPDSKSENDRIYEIVSNDEVRVLERGAQQVEPGQDYSLRRGLATR
ncbi:copper resistance protein NlpE [Lysobacter sp. A3-1-A15]|uniref:copper resistance protein NlpE n=1 Tax=Novilysobacter viscosus TaxID=3098602 RepID=UPI002EDACB9C